MGKTVNNLDNSGLNPKNSVLVKVYKDSLAKQLSNNAESAGGRGAKPRLLKDIERGETCYEGLEVWSLSDVVFLDDSPAILGRVVTVDQLQAIVDISHASSEVGTMDSLSTAQSTLKVFKLTDIESCMDRSHPRGVRCHAPPKGEKGSGDPVHVTAKAEGEVKGSSDGGFSVSQHIAGVVQHRPACLLMPSPPSSGSTMPHSLHPGGVADPDSAPNHAPPCTCIHGYYPLAIHSTNNGPIMLVKRVSDNTAFLVCSGHSGFPSFGSSSFVSLNSRDGKPGRCTVDEESVPACDSGLDRSSWLPPPIVSPMGDSPDGLTSARSDDTPAIAEDLEELKLSSKADKSSGSLEGSCHPSFIQFHKSDAIMLQDANGIVCPLSDGLRLKSSHLPGQHGGGKGACPLRPYRCIVTRSQVVRKDVTVLVVVVGEWRVL